MARTKQVRGSGIGHTLLDIVAACAEHSMRHVQNGGQAIRSPGLRGCGPCKRGRASHRAMQRNVRSLTMHASLSHAACLNLMGPFTRFLGMQTARKSSSLSQSGKQLAMTKTLRKTARKSAQPTRVVPPKPAKRAKRRARPGVVALRCVSLGCDESRAAASMHTTYLRFYLAWQPGSSRPLLSVGCCQQSAWHRCAHAPPHPPPRSPLRHTAKSGSTRRALSCLCARRPSSAWCARSCCASCPMRASSPARWRRCRRQPRRLW